jgi:hypothetical protein
MKALLLAAVLGSPNSDWPIYTAGFADAGPSYADPAMVYAVVEINMPADADTCCYRAIPISITWTASTGELAQSVWAPGDMGLRFGPKFADWRATPSTSVSNSCDRRESHGWDGGWCDVMQGPTGDQAWMLEGPPVSFTPGVPDTLVVVAFSVDPAAQPVNYCDTVDARGLFGVAEIFRCDEVDWISTEGATPVDAETWGRIKALYREETP